MRKRVQVKAVWDRDLEALLDSLGVTERLARGELRCLVCGRIVGLDDIGAILPHGDGAELSCEDSACVGAVSLPGGVAAQ